MLTLSEKTYLSEVISRRFPQHSAESYKIAEGFTQAQRGLFLASIRNKDKVKATEILENVMAFQIGPKE